MTPYRPPDTLTPNEARRSEGLPPMDGGDNLLVPANSAALGSDMSGTPADGAGRPDDGTSPAAGLSTGGDQPNAKPVSGGGTNDDSAVNS